jgi:hypothetical protein
MRVQEKTHHIDTTISGSGIDEIKYLIVKLLPETIVIDLRYLCAKNI